MASERAGLRRCAALPPEAWFLNGAGDGVDVSRRHQVRAREAGDLLELFDEFGANPYAFAIGVVRLFHPVDDVVGNDHAVQASFPPLKRGGVQSPSSAAGSGPSSLMTR